MSDKRREIKGDGENKRPAIPPHDYKGSQSCWIITLIQFGHWDENDPAWYGDVMLTSEEWWEILEHCEKGGYKKI